MIKLFSKFMLVQLFGMLISACSLQAALFFEIDTTISFKCVLSFRHHNRIVVDKGRVKKVIFPDDLLAIKMEEESGQVFICAKGLVPHELTVSVVTSNGLVQDIEISFDDIGSEVIILKEPQVIAFEEPEDCDFIPINEICRNIKRLLKGELPIGYAVCEFDKFSWHPKKGISIHSLAKFEKSDDILFLYSIKNTSRFDKQILECELECENSKWVFLEKNTLAPNEIILGIVSIGKYE